MVLLEHPVHGMSLIDTGYSKAFFEATAAFPQRLYRWLVPPVLPVAGGPADVLRSHGLDPSRLDRVFLSHFHGDHIGGLKDLPAVPVVYRTAARRRLAGLSTWRQVTHGFLSALLPHDLDSRTIDVPEEQFIAGTGPLAGFQVYDFFGDGDLVLVDLPGHADGHTGYVIRERDQTTFYVVDACWDIPALIARRGLPWISRIVQHDPVAWSLIHERLRAVAAVDGWRLTACHCLRTQDHVPQHPC